MTRGLHCGGELFSDKVYITWGVVVFLRQFAFLSCTCIVGLHVILLLSFFLLFFPDLLAYNTEPIHWDLLLVQRYGVFCADCFGFFSF